jgi:hypothetical protein
MILDEQRTLHEEVERLEQAIAERVIEEPNHVSLAPLYQLARLTFGRFEIV